MYLENMDFVNIYFLASFNLPFSPAGTVIKFVAMALPDCVVSNYINAPWRTQNGQGMLFDFSWLVQYHGNPKTFVDWGQNVLKIKCCFTCSNAWPTVYFEFRTNEGICSEACSLHWSYIVFVLFHGTIQPCDRQRLRRFFPWWGIASWEKAISFWDIFFKKFLQFFLSMFP